MCTVLCTVSIYNNTFSRLLFVDCGTNAWIIKSVMIYGIKWYTTYMYIKCLIYIHILYIIPLISEWREPENKFKLKNLHRIAWCHTLCNKIRLLFVETKKCNFCFSKIRFPKDTFGLNWVFWLKIWPSETQNPKISIITHQIEYSLDVHKKVPQ